MNQTTGVSQSIELPEVLVGSTWLGQVRNMQTPVPVVDTVKAIGGSTCTIFQRMNPQGDMLRVATNVQNAKGERAIGTFIAAKDAKGQPNPVLSQVLEGKTYVGRAFVVDRWYIAAYSPIFGADGPIQGMIYAGVPQESAKSLRRGIMDFTIGETGYVYVLDDQGHYVISQGGRRDGEDISEMRDDQGRFF